MPTDATNTISRWEEMVVALLLSFAALASSWCGYQADLWSGIQDMHYNESVMARTESVGATGIAHQVMAVDVGLFISWLNATTVGQGNLAEFYRTRFRDEFKPAFEAWLATDPLRDPQAESTPFMLPQYRLEELARGARLSQDAGRHFQLAQRADQRSDSYVLVTVILSSVLFLAGIASNFDRRPVRWGVMTTASILLLYGLFRIAFLPVA